MKALYHCAKIALSLQHNVRPLLRVTYCVFMKKFACVCKLHACM